MPRLGDFMTEGTVVSLAKSQGDEVNQGEVIAEIETEKLNYDLESVAGRRISPGGGCGCNGSGGRSHRLRVGGGRGCSLPRKLLLRRPARRDARHGGAVLPVGVEEEEMPFARRPAPGDLRPISTLICRRSRPPVPGGRVVDADVRAFDEQQKASPAVTRLRRPELGDLRPALNVDLSQVTPTGPRGRIVEADVRAFADSQAAEQAPAMPPGLPEPSRSEPLSGMRRGIAQHMSESLRSTAQLSYFLEVDVTEAQRLRREASAEHDTTLTIAHVLIKACAETLKRIPVMNAVLANDAIHYFDQVNIGVAVALDDGLIVPVLRDVGNMDIYQISTATHEMAIKAREGTLSPDDVLGGTFTISVLGVVDGFTPILNRPQSAILGVGRSVQKPVVVRGEVVVREMMTLSLTADHQVIDGAVAAGFMRRLQATVERPTALFR